MLGSKAGIVLAVALAMAGTAPAFAGMNGTDYLNYIDAARRSESNLQAYAEWQGAWASTRPVRPQATPDVPTKLYPHRYYGGPRSIH